MHIYQPNETRPKDWRDINPNAIVAILWTVLGIVIGIRTLIQLVIH